MSVTPGRARPSAEGIVSGFVDGETVALLAEAIAQASVSAIATDLLAFWPPAKPPFILTLFEDLEQAESESPRLAAMAATGAAVVVGVPTSTETLPSTVYTVDLRACEDLIGARAHVVLQGSFATALVAARSEVVLTDASEDPELGLYNARWTFRRPRVADAMTQLLRPLRSVLPAPLLDTADAAIARAGEVEIGGGESNLLGVLEALSAALIAAPVLAAVVSSEEKKRPRIVRDE